MDRDELILAVALGIALENPERRELFRDFSPSLGGVGPLSYLFAAMVEKNTDAAKKLIDEALGKLGVKWDRKPPASDSILAAATWILDRRRFVEDEYRARLLSESRSPADLAAWHERQAKEIRASRS